MATRLIGRRLTLAGRLRTKRARAAGVGVSAFAVLTSVLVPGAIAGPEPKETTRNTAERLAKRVTWGPCDADVLELVPEEQRKLYTCAVQQVPLDHAKPRGEKIDIALMRRAAEKPRQKTGTLVAATGGPGLPSRELNATIGSMLDQQVLDSFDIVSFDPRGVGGSTNVGCFSDPQEAAEVFSDIRAVPLTKEEVAGTLDAYVRYGEACEQNAGKLIRNMSTKDIARDMEWLRAGLRERQLNYLGLSYGTLLGATYANMYPGRVRAMVLDAAVDPVTRTNDGLQQDRQRAAGFEAALDAFLEACKEAGDNCAFSSGDPRKKFDELRDHLRKQPLVLPDGTTVNISDFTSFVGSTLMYAAALPALATQLQTAYDLAVSPAEPGQARNADVKSLDLLDGSRHKAWFEADQDATEPEPASPSEYYDAHFSINCSDKPFTHKQRHVRKIVANWEKDMPTFARYQAFAEEAACPVWPTDASDNYNGPWNQKTKNPILVIGGVHDPATPYEFAERMTKSLHKARLLTVDGFGHGFVGHSTEGDKAVATYLTKLRLPAPGTKVKLDTPAFPSS